MKLLLPLLCLAAASATALETRPSPTGAEKDQLATAAERWEGKTRGETPSFRRHVVPLLARQGCSGRECHGAFSGQGGFQLSLFGYDFDKDFQEITTDPEDGPRIEAAHPEQSLLLTKPALDGEKHKGKKRIDKGSWEYNLLLKWIAGGAKLDVKETGEFDRLEISPGEILFKRPGDIAQLKILAHWKDGTVEDVTQITRFRTNDESVAEISPSGVVTCKGVGDTHVVAFYDNGVQPIPVILPSSNLTGPNFPKVPTRTKVDELVVAKLRKLGVVPSDLCTDAEFLRRVSLDVTATLPTPGEIRAFLADRAPDKRGKKVDELLKRPGYAAWWTTLLCDFGGNDPRRISAPTGDQNFFSEKLSRQWYEWIAHRLTKNEPYDKIAEGIIMATSRTSADQPYADYALEMASYFRTENPADFRERPTMPYFWQRNNIRKPEEKALAFAHTFLGVRIECAQCHKHPFDQWTKTDFEQFQAFFEPIQYSGKGAKMEENGFAAADKAFKAGLGPEAGNQKYRAAEFRKQIDAGVVLPWPELYVSEPPKPKQMSEKEIAKRKQKDPNFSGRVLTPKILGGGEVMLTEYPDARVPLMQWLRNKENPYFARAFVNRVWANYFGRGIVEPADDMNLANPPTNRELLDYLTDGFVSHGYNIHWLHREIVNSDTYQRSWQPTPTNKLDEKNFSHATIRRLPAEMVFDGIRMATLQAPAQEAFIADLERRAIGPSAVNYKGAGDYALTAFGKPARNMNCDCERTNDPTLLQTIYTRNDSSFLGMIDSAKKDGGAWIDELRLQTDPALSPERLGKNVLQAEADLERVQQVLKERNSKPNPPSEDLRQKLDAKVKNAADQVERAKNQLAAGKDRKPVDLTQVIEDAFLRTVSRPPTDEELAKAKEDVAAAKIPSDGVRDLLWALLNTREFIVNH
jgi:hypothetical protein